MSNSQGKNFRKLPLDPNRCIKLKNEEQCKSIFDFLRHAPVCVNEAFVQSMVRMTGDMRPAPQTETMDQEEFPGIEKAEDDEVLDLKLTAPGGLRKEEAHVFVKNGVLVIEVDHKPPSESSSKGGARFLIDHRFGPGERCKVEEIKAEISNGVLIVVCPKEVKKEGDEDKDVGVHKVEVK